MSSTLAGGCGLAEESGSGQPTDHSDIIPTPLRPPLSLLRIRSFYYSPSSLTFYCLITLPAAVTLSV